MDVFRLSDVHVEAVLTEFPSDESANLGCPAVFASGADENPHAHSSSDGTTIVVTSGWCTRPVVTDPMSRCATPR